MERIPFSSPRFRAARGGRMASGMALVLDAAAQGASDKERTAREHHLRYLAEAAWHGDIEKVQQLATAHDLSGPTMLRMPLFAAIEGGCADCCEALLDLGADANSMPMMMHGVLDAESPLLTAVDFGHAAVAEVLMARGADAMALGSNGWSPVTLATAHADIAVLEALLLNGGEGICGLDGRGQNPLTLALYNENHGSSNQLVDKSRQMLALLLAHGADPRATTSGRSSPACMAAEMGCTEALLMFLQHCPNLIDIDIDGGADALIAAATNEDTTRLLIEHGARLGPETLARAVGRGNVFQTRHLLQLGADPNVPYQGAKTVLCFAAGMQWSDDRACTEVVRVLLAHGANTSLGAPLAVAASVENISAMQVLISAGVDVNDGSPAVAAVMHNHDRALRLLAEAGATVTEDALHMRLSSLSATRPPNFDELGVPVTMLLMSGNADVDDDAAGQCFDQIVAETGDAATQIVMAAGRRARVRAAHVFAASRLSSFVAAAKKMDIVVPVVAVSIERVSSGAMLETLARHWRKCIDAVGLACIPILAGVFNNKEDEQHQQNTVNASQARAIAASQGMRFVVIGDTDVGDLVRAAATSAIQSKFEAGRSVRRQQAAVLARGLHPQLGKQSPLGLVDSFVIQSIS